MVSKTALLPHSFAQGYSETFFFFFFFLQLAATARSHICHSTKQSRLDEHSRRYDNRPRKPVALSFYPSEGSSHNPSNILLFTAKPRASIRPIAGQDEHHSCPMRQWDFESSIFKSASFATVGAGGRPSRGLFRDGLRLASSREPSSLPNLNLMVGDIFPRAGRRRCVLSIALLKPRGIGIDRPRTNPSITV